MFVDDHVTRYMGADDVARSVGETWRRSGAAWGFHFYNLFLLFL